MTTTESEVAGKDGALYETLGMVYSAAWPSKVLDLLCVPAEGEYKAGRTIDDAFELVEQESFYALPQELLPLCFVDDRSLACVVLEAGEGALPLGSVVRWHLDEVAPDRQLLLLDVDPLLYVSSLAQELGTRDSGLARILDEIGPSYQEAYLSHEKRPRDFVIRPVRVACQNVIVGLAAIGQEASFDGLTVVAWQTCEVPHVATHEANRALAALVLCDAFQNGGTMEIRFDRSARVALGSKSFSYDGHPEGQVPASLRRYGRTVGVELGAEDPGAIFPAEARELFLAVTPMRPELRARVGNAIEERGTAPERLCFALLSGVWDEIELDWMLGTSNLADSILSGGADWRQRLSRQAEMEVCRTARMAGMLFARLDGRDGASAEEGPRVVEDQRVGVDWQIDPELGAVHFVGRDLEQGLPWLAGKAIESAEPLTVLPRSIVTAEVEATVERLSAAGPVAILVPRDTPDPQLPTALLMRCPDRLSDLDKAVEEKLLTARISRG